MKDPELARGPSFISDLGCSNREERSDGSRHPGLLNREERSDGSRHPGLLNREAQRRLPSRVLIQKILDTHFVDVLRTVFVINLLTHVRKTELAN